MIEHKLEEENIEALKKAERGLLGGFVWENSVEGSEYWSKIRLRLLRMIEYGNVEGARIKPSFEKDELVRAGDDPKYLCLRYYSHEENGKHHCFSDGATSITAEGRTTLWNVVEKV